MKLSTIPRYSFFILVVAFAAYLAYDIRLNAIKNVWAGIHEFDPWFNFRAAEYFEKNGWKKFFTWYDHRSWYPLGRPVGTTIYPGLQIASVYIYRFLKMIGSTKSLYDVCVYFPAWFGSVATIFVGLIGLECSGNSVLGGALSALIMSIIPCHIMRSMGGGFDNEALAMSTMTATFYFWVKSINKKNSTFKTILFGILAGLAEASMAAAWGGYIFVVNMIGLSCLFLIFVKFFFFRESEWNKEWKRIYIAYSLWYIISICGSVLVPVIGWTPLSSMEQVLPLIVFIILQVFMIYHILPIKEKISKMNTIYKKNMFYAVFVFGLITFWYLNHINYFAPFSSRVRSLFIPHSKTGNPLVDSVAEHQPTNKRMFNIYLGITSNIAPLGFIVYFVALVIGKGRKNPTVNAKYFLMLLAIVTYYFAGKMNRLIILGAPGASILSGLFVADIWKWVYAQPFALMSLYKKKNDKKEEKKEEKKVKKQEKKGKKKKKKKKQHPTIKSELQRLKKDFDTFYKSPIGMVVRLISIIVIVFLSNRNIRVFYYSSQQFATYSSNPILVFKTRTRNGQEILVEDYLHSYEWLRDNTPEDSRVLSWWDYGYQINGVGKRITLADGNTWNLEHIAFIGKMLTAEQNEAYETARHVADYVLVWSGQGNGDLAKSPQMARIASSVYDICGIRDPLCRSFGFSLGPNGEHIPSPSMKRSLLYNLVMNRRTKDAYVDSSKFEEVYISKNGLVRIYKILNTSQESKDFTMNPDNWVCDAPGSWYCVGQYPPAVAKPPKTHRNIKYNNRGELIH